MATNQFGWNTYDDLVQRNKARGGMAIPGWEVPATAGMYSARTTATNLPLAAPATQAIPTAPQQRQPFQFNTPAPAISMRTPNTTNDATRRIAKAQSWDAQNNVPMFDNQSIARGGYDQPAIKNMNVVPAETIGGMVSSMVNPKGEQALSGALKAAAARGDWDAVGRYYASQGQTFGGKMYGAGGQDDLYNRAFGPGIKAVKGRDRAAKLLGEREGFATELEKTRMLGDTQRDVQELQNKGYYDATGLGNQGRYDVEALQQSGLDRRLTETQKFETPFKQAEAQYRQAQAEGQSLTNKMSPTLKLIGELGELFKNNTIQSLPADKQKYYSDMYQAALKTYAELMGTEKKADGGLVGGGPAPGRAMQPMVNPMGSFGMPSSMQSLDPVIRQYGQYVSAATQYGLQPLPFTKFIDVMASARQQMQQLPTQGGVTPFADGGYVENDSMYADGGLVDNRSWLAKLFGAAPSSQSPASSQVMAGRGAALLGDTNAGQAGRAIQGRNAALEEALREAQSARQGYADGGAIPVAGRQVLGPGGPTSDSIPAVVDGNRPAALSSGEYVLPTEAVKFYGTDKLDKMVAKAKGIK